MSEQDEQAGNASREVELGITEAALVCGRHRVTLAKKLAAGAFPNAHKDPRGRWRVPISDLLAAGLTPNRPRAAEDVQQAATAVVQSDITRLEHELAEARRRADVAEAISAERLDRIADMRQALRLLEAGPKAPRRRWWRRSPSE